MTEQEKDKLLLEVKRLHDRHTFFEHLRPDTFEPGMMEYLDQSDGSVDFETGLLLLRFEARGTRYEGRPEIIERVQVNEPLQIVRDKENRFNPNNFTLLTNTGKNIGNMPAELCNALAPLYDKEELTIDGAKVSFVDPLSKRNRHAKRPMVFILLKGRVLQSQEIKQEEAFAEIPCELAVIEAVSEEIVGRKSQDSAFIRDVTKHESGIEDPVENERRKFFDWLIAKNISQRAANEYLANLEKYRQWADSEKPDQSDLLLIDDVYQLQRLAEDLEYKRKDPWGSYAFRSAVKIYIQYREQDGASKGIQTDNVKTDISQHKTATEEVKQENDEHLAKKSAVVLEDAAVQVKAILDQARVPYWTLGEQYIFVEKMDMPSDILREIRKSEYVHSVTAIMRFRKVCWRINTKTTEYKSCSSLRTKPASKEEQREKTVPFSSAAAKQVPMTREPDITPFEEKEIIIVKNRNAISVDKVKIEEKAAEEQSANPDSIKEETAVLQVIRSVQTEDKTMFALNNKDFEDHSLADELNIDLSIFETIRIEELHLGVRSANCLNAVKLKTVADVLSKSKNELHTIPFMSSKSIDEIIKKLHEYVMNHR